MKAEKPENKRKSVRVPVQFDTQISFQDQKFKGGALNLSVDGMFIHTAKPFPENERIVLLFRLPTSPEPMRMHARIVWGRTVHGEGSSTFGMGVRFEQAETSQRKELVKYIQGLLKT